MGQDKNSSDHNNITFRSTGITNLDNGQTQALADNMPNSAHLLNNLYSSESDKLDIAAALLSQSIMEAFTSVTHLLYGSCKVKPPPWDTPAVTKARRDMITNKTK